MILVELEIKGGFLLYYGLLCVSASKLPVNYCFSTSQESIKSQIIDLL